MKFNIDKSIEILERTPTVLEHLLSGLSNEWTTSNEGENTWSPYDVIGHLIHGEKTDWIPRAQIILSDAPNKTFEPFDRFAQMSADKQKSLEELLAEFKALRSENINLLKAFSVNKKTLTQTGIHPELGQTNLKNLLATWVVHDLGHITQISRVMAKQYKTEVGPWEQFLTILKS